ncbi:MAG: class I SAM-dependent methyltransferase [bacterium]|nr:class I SAM-dependent methyltransferase [bacterium]
MSAIVCQLCGSKELTGIIDLGLHPLADTFWKAEDIPKTEKRYPLRVLLCQRCGYAGLETIVPAEERYTATDYSYTSSNSRVAVTHFQELASEVVRNRGIKENDLVVDIGSNDGTLLMAFRDQTGCQVLGVDPSPNIAKLANASGVPTLPNFFDEAAVDNILEQYGKPRLITGTNVLNHSSNIADFMGNIVKFLAPGGVFVFEVPYLLTLVESRAFDTIYLEHISYLAIKPLQKFFQRFGLAIEHLDKIDYMGGSIRVYVSRNKESREVANFVAAEEQAGIFQTGTYEKFMDDVKGLKAGVLREITELKARGEKIVGIGAATKGNTFLNYCGIDNTMLEFITEASPLKIGKFTPGSRIPIKSDADITPDFHYALILPWNIADFLKNKLADRNLKFITPKIP